MSSFGGADRELRVRTTEEVRSRLDDAYGRKDLWVISKREIASLLEDSGFPLDTALAPFEMRQLGRRQRADEFLDGFVSREGGEIKVDARLYLIRDNRLSQPIPTVRGKTPEEAAQKLVTEIVAARQQVPHERECANAARAKKFDAAAAAARAGIAAYARGTLARLCLLTVYSQVATPVDSIARLANEIMAIDAKNTLAIESAARAYDSLGVREKAIEMWSALLATDPANPELAQKVVQAFGRGGDAELAKPIILNSVTDHPENAGLVRLQWLVLLSTGDWKGAIKAGEALQKLEPAAADSNFLFKLASAYRADSQPSKALEVISRAYGRYPNNADIYLLYAQIIREESDQVLARGMEKFPTAPGLHVLRAQTLKSAGKAEDAVQSIRKAVAIDPKLPRGFVQLAQMFLDVSQPDSAAAALEEGLRAGVDSVIIAQFALSRGNALYKAASASKRREDFQLAMRFLALSDRVTPTPQAKFLVGASAFSIGQSAATDAPKTKSCELSRLAEDALTTAAQNLPAGETIAPDAAKQYLDYVGQMKPFVENQIKAFCS